MEEGGPLGALTEVHEILYS